MTSLIGNTPCVLLPIPSYKSKIYIKLEEFNWGGSIKSRIGYQMIRDAEEEGRIDINNPANNIIIEGTGGNTGIGIAQYCAQKGYKCILVVPDNYSKVRVKVLKELGAEVFLSDHTRGNCSHLEMVESILEKHPEYIHLNQINNPSNPKAHYLGTGKEIISQVEGITHFVAGVGSGGTLSGVGRALKEKNPEVNVYAVQPKGCDILNGYAIPHKIQGLAIGRIPSVFDRALVDSVISIDEDETVKYQSVLSKTTGLYLGFSSIANILACLEKAREEDGIYVTVAPDGGRNYL